MSRKILREDAIDARTCWLQGVDQKQHRVLLARYLLQCVAQMSPGRAVELRVPGVGAIQFGSGAAHTRGTPPYVIELELHMWIRIALGEVSWSQARGEPGVSVLGVRADLEGIVPIPEYYFVR